jgi:hypothetical protein
LVPKTVITSINGLQRKKIYVSLCYLEYIKKGVFAIKLLNHDVTAYGCSLLASWTNEGRNHYNRYTGCKHKKCQKFFSASVTEFTKSHTSFVFIWIKTHLLYLCCYIRISVLELTSLYSQLKCKSTQQTTAYHARLHATLFCHYKDLC